MCGHTLTKIRFFFCVKLKAPLFGCVQYSRLKNSCPYIPTVWKPLDVSIGITALSLPRKHKQDIDTASWILPMELCQSDVLHKLSELDEGMEEQQCRNCIREVLLGTLKKQNRRICPLLFCATQWCIFFYIHFSA